MTIMNLHPLMGLWGRRACVLIVPPLLGCLQRGKTPLYTAAAKDKVAVAKVLIAAGATLTNKIRVRLSRHPHPESRWISHGQELM